MSQLPELLDQVRPELEPLAPHYLADKERVVKERYIVLMLASLLDGHAIMEPQTRLLEMLLASIGGVQTLVFYIQKVAKLDKQELAATLEMIRTDTAAASVFIFDLMVVMRIGGIPTEKQFYQITQLALLLNTTETQKVIKYYVFILGEYTIIKESDIIKKIHAQDFDTPEIKRTVENSHVKLTSTGGITIDSGNGSTNNGLFFSEAVQRNVRETALHIEKTELKKRNLILYKASPFNKKQIKDSQSFSFRARGIGTYKVVIIPKGIIAKLYKTNWLANSWQDGESEIVADILILPNGLNAWTPFFISEK